MMDAEHSYNYTIHIHCNNFKRKDLSVQPVIILYCVMLYLQDLPVFCLPACLATVMPGYVTCMTSDF